MTMTPRTPVAQPLSRKRFSRKRFSQKRPAHALAGAFLLALTWAGCADFLDVNEDPNAATEAPINGLLAYTTYTTAINEYRVANAFTAQFTQYLASPNEAENTDIYLASDYSSTWDALYNVLTDCSDMIVLGESTGARQHVGVGKVLTAVNLGLVVDNWGAAPYADAFTGETLTPTYDSGEALYADIERLLTEARADLADTTTLFLLDADSDFIHGGDVAAWDRTAAAVLARTRNHLSKTDAYDPAAVLAAVDEAYTSSADDAALTTFEIRNPWAGVAINNENLLLGGWLSANFVDALNGATYGTFDPRLPLLTDTNAVGAYVGTVNGAGRVGDGTGADQSYLEVDGAASGEDSPLPIITYAEVKFVEAEAALASGDATRATTAFREGVRADMATVGVEDDAAEAYLAAAYPDLGEAGVTRADIFREKYVALFLEPEAWVDARRYDYAYAGFALPANAALATFIRRVDYPATETDRNRGNVPAVGSLTEPVFWDQ